MTAAPLIIVRTVEELRAVIRRWRENGDTIGLVPTMGALHEGHLSLIRRARTRASRAVATLFVNPKQFAPNEDFARYPRDEEGDARKLAGVGCDLLYAPAVEEMYPPGHAVSVSVPGLGDILEGACRPGFFTGVATVVSKLLVQALPDVAVFGEKDYQQLLVVKRLVADLGLPVRIEGAPTVREADGLAMSSRNAYLTAAERAAAPTLHRTLSTVAQRFENGEAPAALAEWAAGEIAAAGFAKVDYVTVRDAATLDAEVSRDKPARVLGAAWLGRTRLIDNVPA
jgi:pantoate--beta-alanine ligase